MRILRWRPVAAAILVASLSACRGGGGGSTPAPPPPPTFTVSATVSGLAGTGFVLRNNGANDLPVNANGAAVFTTAIVTGSNYNVTVATQPNGPSQTCTVANATGTVTANVTNVIVNCATNAYTVSATVANLLGSGLVLRNNNTNDLAVAGNGQTSFPAAIASGANYDVTVATQPSSPAQVCTPANGGGIVGGSNVIVQVTCGPALYLLGGTVSGLVGGVTLTNDQTQFPLAANGAFSLGLVTDQSNYTISVATQPTDYTCRITNGAGMVSGAHVSNVSVTCTINPPDVPVLAMTGSTKRFSLAWTRPARANFYRVYETRNTDSDYELLSTDLLTDTFDDDIGVHLENWAHLRYRVDACNSTGCTPSAPGIPQEHLSTIGYFKASNSRTSDWFGLFTAVSGDGNTIAIAAPSEDSSSTSINGPNQTTFTTPNSGAVYVYTRDAVLNGWVQQAHIKASGSVASLGFGWGIALSDDGSTLAVGAYTDGTGAPMSGAVYVYSRNPATANWTEQGYLRASNFGQDDYFGFSLAISGDGNTLLIGAPGESSDATGIGAPQTNNSAPNSGAAYVFGRTGGVWTQRNYIKASNTGNSDSFGSSVAISADGSTIAISAPGEDSGATGVDGDQNGSGSPDSGAVYVFLRAGNSWAQQAYLKSPDSVPHPSSPGDALGDALALSGNGDTLAVSSIHESSNARGIGGDPSNNDAQDSGAAYVFSRNGATWSPQAYIKASNSDASDFFGFSLDLSDAGDIMAIGSRGEASSAVGAGGDENDNTAYGSGAVYSFQRTGTAWEQLNYVHARSTDPIDLFGRSLSLSADGKAMVVGAYGEDGDGTIFNADADSDAAPESGAAYLF